MSKNKFKDKNNNEKPSKKNLIPIKKYDYEPEDEIYVPEYIYHCIEFCYKNILRRQDIDKEGIKIPSWIVHIIKIFIVLIRFFLD